MIIGACGFGSTGSSAVTDYLKEYDIFQVMDKFEFTWVSDVDSLIDLDFHLNQPHMRTADSIFSIERYRILCKKYGKIMNRAGVPEQVFMKSVNDFLDSIVQTSWKWDKPSFVPESLVQKMTNYFLVKFNLIPRWQVRNGKQWEGYPYSDVYLSVKPQDFDQKAKKHVMEIINKIAYDLDSKPLVLDQPFSGNNPQSCFKFFDDPYAIIVDRDPRDNYVFGKTKLLSKRFSNLMPLNDVKDFVIYYRALRKNQPYTIPNNRVLSLKFEDLVYHYDETTKKLREFLNLPENPNPKSIFDPAISMPNTQVWKRYPQFAEDIAYIERELSEYLFDYTGCPEPDLNGQMFVGKSPKNI